MDASRHIQTQRDENNNMDGREFKNQSSNSIEFLCIARVLDVDGQ